MGRSSEISFKDVSEMDMTVIDGPSLRNLCVDILVAEGFGQDVSADIVDVLLEADLGEYLHGVARPGDT